MKRLARRKNYWNRWKRNGESHLETCVIDSCWIVQCWSQRVEMIGVRSFLARVVEEERMGPDLCVTCTNDKHRDASW